MEIEPLEPAALPDPAPVRRRRPVRLALAVAGLTVAAGVVVAISGDGDRPPAVQTATAPEESAGAPIDLAEPVDATTTTGATLEATSSTVGPSTTATHRANPTTTTARPSTTTTTRPTSVGGRGVVLSAEQPGVWVADLATGTLRRVADAGPFDVAGDTVLTAKSRQVFATPLTGGDTVLHYEAPSPGDVVWIDAGVDGSALAAIFDGANGNYHLLDPSGRKVSTGWIGHNFAWSADGTKLAITSLAGRPGPASYRAVDAAARHPDRAQCRRDRPPGRHRHRSGAGSERPPVGR